MKTTKLTKKQAVINVVDLMVRYRITPQMVMKELEYAIKLHNKIK